MWKTRAYVKLKERVLDAQGRAVEQVLKQEGYDVSDVRIGKTIEFVTEKKMEQDILREMGSKLLFNPLIETIEFSEDFLP
ncbi:MAG: phosphoribosylformylglycinamidine synthase subunit PurS [Firmicutes bacterium]|nr:phosphoribosylformylglycinamidine synthase subunit PurS [Bacillota bacterium]